ncbi:hypothetical protein IGL98_000240 [Enterococcus sp. DIV0840]|uniref:DUF4176 domain-containing protein n=1 Tax=unclassified Enterococcus TaxID=2608891 RepID=UPI0030CF02EC
MELLPIGTVVTLNDGEQELMITARFPLYDNNGTVGYFDYAGCFYPQGQFNEGNYFFNSEDIKTIHFTGYISEEEQELQKNIKQQLKSTTYKKLSIKETL